MSENQEKVWRAPLPWTVTTSLVVHASIALALLLRLHPPVPVPLGIEMLYLGSERAPSTSPSLPVRRAARAPAEKIQGAADLPKAPVSPAANVATEASSEAGPVGKVDGIAVSAIERYKFELRLFLESRKIYPESAKRLHQTGQVRVRFRVDAEGALRDVTLEQPANAEILNRAALDLIQSASRFKPLPQEAQLNELTVSLPIEYIL